jgi:hypothetical protein
MSTAHQQVVKIQQRKLENTTPRKQFIIDFINQFQEICNDPDEFVLLALDANSNMLDDTNGIQLLARECGMVDLCESIHPGIGEFPTQVRGSKRIDYMIGTRNLLPFIMKIGYIPFNEIFDTDHRPMFVDISQTILEDPSKIPEPKIRLVGSNSTNKESERYIRHLYNKLLKLNVFQQAEELYQLSQSEVEEDQQINIMQKLNELDDIITTAMLVAEKSTCSLKNRVM